MQDLPYKCKQVLELYGTEAKEVNSLEKLVRYFKRIGITAEMYYTEQKNISYATLVVFVPWQFHAELSKFDPKAFKKWHTVKANPKICFK